MKAPFEEIYFETPNSVTEKIDLCQRTIQRGYASDCRSW